MHMSSLNNLVNFMIIIIIFFLFEAAFSMAKKKNDRIRRAVDSFTCNNTLGGVYACSFDAERSMYYKVQYVSYFAKPPPVHLRAVHDRLELRPHRTAADALSGDPIVLSSTHSIFESKNKWCRHCVDNFDLIHGKCSR